MHVKPLREGTVRAIDAINGGGFGLFDNVSGRLVGKGATPYRAQLRAGKTGWYTAESLTPKGID